MKTVDIRQKLHQCIETAQIKKVKAIYAIVETQIEEADNFWDDKFFLTELKRREKSYLSGKAKTYSIDQVVPKAKQAIKSKTRK